VKTVHHYLSRSLSPLSYKLLEVFKMRPFSTVPLQSFPRLVSAVSFTEEKSAGFLRFTSPPSGVAGAFPDFDVDK